MSKSSTSILAQKELSSIGQTTYSVKPKATDILVVSVPFHVQDRLADKEPTKYHVHYLLISQTKLQL